jgi:hypothetical protein
MGEFFICRKEKLHERKAETNIGKTGREYEKLE